MWLLRTRHMAAVEGQALIDRIEVVHLPIHQDHGILAMLADEVWIMGDNHLSPVGPLLEELIVTLGVEPAVPYRRDLIDQITVELDNHRDCEGQTGPHPRRVLDNVFAQVDPQLRELLHEVHLILERHIIDPADQTHVIVTRQMIVKGITQRDRPRHLHVADDLARGGPLRSAQQTDQCRLAGTVTTKDPELLARFDQEIDPVQDRPLTPMDGVTLSDVLKLNHRDILRDTDRRIKRIHRIKTQYSKTLRPGTL